MSSTSHRRRPRSSLPVDDLVSDYVHRRSVNRRSVLSTGTFSRLPPYVDSKDCEFVCIYCGALFWFAERVASLLRKINLFTRAVAKWAKWFCHLHVFHPPPVLLTLFNDRHFRDNIRAYNAMFAMTSFGAKVDYSINNGGGPYTFKIFGQISHWIGSLCPEPDTASRFLQLYIYDSINEVSNRLRVYDGSEGSTLNDEVVGILLELLGSINRYVRMLKTAVQIAGDYPLGDYAIRLYHNVRDPRYSLPIGDVVGGIVTGDDPNASSFDIIVYGKSGRPQCVSKLHSSYMPLQYPLLLPHGEPGWCHELKLTFLPATASKILTINMYYSYVCHDRQYVHSFILHGGRLFQQYLVDAYVCIEECRLTYIRQHQNELRSEYVSGVYDALCRGDSEGRSIGKRIFLPSSFVGGPRYMFSHYQDALAIARVYGNPQYFITFTCNANWNEVTRFMVDHALVQTQDRPDILSRIFRIKVAEFITFLKEDKTFGDVSTCK